MADIRKGMIARCHDPGRKDFPRYGGRKIEVCERWRSSLDYFIADMGYPLPGMTLERKDNDGNYEPGNCKWATRKEQQRNTRRNRRLSFNGQIKTLVEWEELTGLSHVIISHRIDKQGMSVKDALTAPLNIPRCGKGKPTLYLTIRGETKSLKVWAKSSGISYQTLRWRFLKGLPPERCLQRR
jgi:hypothetical protein